MKQSNQIFALDSAVVEVQEVFSSHGSLFMHIRTASMQSDRSLTLCPDNRMFNV